VGWEGYGNLHVLAGIRISPVFRSQSGARFARTFSTALNYNTSVQIKAEPWGAESTANINIFDVRTEKDFVIKERFKLAGFFDVYNIFNTSAAQVVTQTSGSSFLRPTGITGPRIARLGVKFDF
jgi:hypothetical protein